MADQPWDSHREWKAESVGQIVTSRFPALLGCDVAYLAEGFDFQVFTVGEWAFKFPKRDDYARHLLVEARLLELVKPGCALRVPHYELVAETVAGDVFGGYRMLNGRPAIELDPEREVADGSAATLAAFISHVHSVDVQAALGVGVGYGAGLREQWRRELQEEFQEVAPALDSELSERTRRAIEDLNATSLHSSIEPTLNHGDLSPDHILVDEETMRICGVIDWSDAFVGDPAFDFGGIVAWKGADFAAKVAALYTRDRDPGLMSRAKAYALNYIIGTMQYGLAASKPAEWRAGLTWLKRFIWK